MRLPGSLDPATAPAGDGYGSFTVNSRGQVNLSGQLADGASFGSVGGLVAAEAFVGCAWGLVGYAMIRALEWQSRIHATLERA